ncbi:hypothetical protein NRB_10860 [Novosphingobium sp. 11B]
MTKPILKRIARALCSHDGLPGNTQFERRPMWERFLPKAKAMLSAIRTPTEEMRQAGVSAHGQKAHPTASEDAGITWETMVNAALHEN